MRAAGNWLIARLADFIGWWFTGPKVPDCSCAKRTHLDEEPQWTEIVVQDPDCPAHNPEVVR